MADETNPFNTATVINENPDVIDDIEMADEPIAYDASVVTPPTPPAPATSDIAGIAKDTVSSAKDAVSSAKDAVSGATDQAKEAASRALEQTKQSAGAALGKAKESVLTQVTSQKDRAGETLGGAAEALHDTGTTFRDKGVPLVGEYADAFAGQIERLSGYLKTSDVDTLVRDVDQFARSNPSLFIGGAFLLGIAAARFLKASDPDRHALVPYTGTDAIVPVQSSDPSI